VSGGVSFVCLFAFLFFADTFWRHLLRLIFLVALAPNPAMSETSLSPSQALAEILIELGC
jgi:hypothetical protein